MNLLEKDYFGLTFRDADNNKVAVCLPVPACLSSCLAERGSLLFQNWLDPVKEMKKQIRGEQRRPPCFHAGETSCSPAVLLRQVFPGTFLLMSSSTLLTPPSCQRTSPGA